ncbi:MAG: universal stress protein [Paucibacter sp.]|nr:universal stress protein [Roseateles sp.]
MYQRILVPYDGSEPSRRGLDEAAKLAKLTGAKVRVAYVIDELIGATGFEPYGIYARDVLASMRTTGQGLLGEARSQAAHGGLTIETEMSESHGHQIADCIIDQAIAWQADLIVIGSHGRRGASHLFMGSDAEKVLRLSPVPVMVVKPLAAHQTA